MQTDSGPDYCAIRSGSRKTMPTDQPDQQARADHENGIAGTTEVTFDLPGAVSKGKRQSYKRTIADLYSMQHRDTKLPSLARVFDEATKVFTHAPIRKVFQTGVRPTFRVLLWNSRTIECTKDHRILTEDGFAPLEDAVGLGMIGSTVVMSRSDIMIGCNGVPAYRNKDWMTAAKARAIASGTGLQGIAVDAGITIHTVRKWLKALGLQFTKSEVASYTPVWNKGKRYSWGHHSAETIEKMRRAARRGSESNLWRGGADRAERLAIADWCAQYRSDFLRAASYQCNRCGTSERLELHHIETVAARPDLAREPSNIEVLCHKCHREHHGLTGDHKTWRARSRGNTLAIHWSKVRLVELVGNKMTYGLEVEHTSSNFVGNGIVVHAAPGK